MEKGTHVGNFHDFQKFFGKKRRLKMDSPWVSPGIQRTSLGGVGIAALGSALSAFSGALVGPSAFAPWRWALGWLGAG